MTSSYLRTFLRETKFCSSTFFCAFSIWFERIPRLHRLVVGELEAVDDLVDPVAGEQADEVVLRGEVEAGLAGVALAARAAAQLVVDAARLVALGAEDVEARRARRTPSPSLMSTPRPAMFVAIVTAPGWPASLMISASRSCCFAFRTLCGMPCRSSSCERCSETSTEIVPTRTGWPLLVALLDVADDRVVLRFLRLVDEVVLVVARDGDVGRDLDDARGRRSPGTPSPRSWPYRSCRRASRRGGSSSGA